MSVAQKTMNDLRALGGTAVWLGAETPRRITMNDEKFKGVDVISVYLWIHQTDLVNQFMEAILNAHYKPGVVWEGLGPAEIPLQAAIRVWLPMSNVKM